MSDHSHHHHDHSGPIAIGATAARVVVGLLAAIGVVVVIAAIVLWPSSQHVDIPLPMQNAGGGAVQTEAGTVIMQDLGACGSSSIGKVFIDKPEQPRAAGYNCQRSIISIDSGPHEGNHTLLEIAPGPGQPDLRAGDHIRLVRQADPSGVPLYSFEDYSRGLPLTLIVLVFVVVIIVVARWRGLRALLGLVFAFAVLVLFMLPALLDGKPAIPVALVAGALILYAVLYLAHGVNLRTSSALLGTLTSMILAAVLSWIAIEATHLTGLSEEQNTNVATYIQHVSITGLLLAGFIIGSLGVLNDVTITQASAAFELAALDQSASRREVFTAAMRVGRDHIASTVYTLVLAYAGGALPLLLLFSVAGRSIRDVLTGDAVAIEIARSSVGGIALALSVPLTTAIAVVLARPFGHRAEPDAAPTRHSRHARSNSAISARRSESASGRRSDATTSARRAEAAAARRSESTAAARRTAVPRPAAEAQPRPPVEDLPRSAAEDLSRPPAEDPSRPAAEGWPRPPAEGLSRPARADQPRADEVDPAPRREWFSHDGWRDPNADPNSWSAEDTDPRGYPPIRDHADAQGDYGHEDPNPRAYPADPDSPQDYRGDRGY